MTLKRTIADRILTTLRLNSKDRFLSKRYILSVAEEKMKFLLSQKLRDRTLYREENIFSQIDCYEFEKIDRVKCDVIEFRTCNHVMKGKKKLPELIFSKFGDSIRLITNLENSEKIGKTTISDHIRNSKRAHYTEKPKYYIRDGYPYIINSEIEAANIELLTLDKRAAEKASCGDNYDECKSALDYEFVGSDKLLEVVIQQTIQEIAGTYMQITPDENPDQNEKSL